MRRAAPIIATFAALLIALFLAYSAAWFYGRAVIGREIGAALLNIQKQGDVVMAVSGPRIGGFPGPYRIELSGSVTARDLSYGIAAPALRIEGWPLAGKALTFSFPEGARIAYGKALYAPAFASLTARVPRSLPSGITRPEMRAWHESGNASSAIEDLSIREEYMEMQGSGDIRLDSDLQPALSLNVRAAGLSEYLDRLRLNGILNDKQLAFAGMILGTLEKTDEETGARYVPTTIQIRNRKLYLGLLRAASLPPVNWPDPAVPAGPPVGAPDNSPAPHR